MPVSADSAAAIIDGSRCRWLDGDVSPNRLGTSLSLPIYAMVPVLACLPWLPVYCRATPVTPQL